MPTTQTVQKHPPLFKYLKEEHAISMITKGEIYIGTLSYYRETEREEIADRNEGKKTSVTTFPEETVINDQEEWTKKIGFLKDSNINYKSGTIKIEKATNFIGNEDINDSYIYCTSKIYSESLKRKFKKDSCVEISDVQGFLDAVDKRFSELGFIYQNLSSGREIEYIGHTVNSDKLISGDWLKDEIYKEEEEFRFSFIPTIKQNGQVIQPNIRFQNEQRLIEFHNAKDIKLNLEPETIICKEVIKFCRWK